MYFTRNIHFVRMASSALWPNPYPFCPVCPPRSLPLFCKWQIFHLPISFPLNMLLYAGKAHIEGHWLSSTGPTLKQLSGSLYFLSFYHSNYNEWRSQVENGLTELINFDIVLHVIVTENKSTTFRVSQLKKQVQAWFYPKWGNSRRLFSFLSTDWNNAWKMFSNEANVSRESKAYL